MENNGKAGSRPSSEGRSNELQEDWPLILDEVRNIERVKRSLPPRVRHNRPPIAPRFGAMIERIFALSKHTAATRAEEGDDPNFSEETGSFETNRIRPVRYSISPRRQRRKMPSAKHEA
jgi:hypothetical protein